METSILHTAEVRVNWIYWVGKVLESYYKIYGLLKKFLYVALAYRRALEASLAT